MSALAVEVKRLTVKFGDFRAVDDISFDVSIGEIFGFLGANGAGKTTTIRVLCGLLKPSEGEVRVAGVGFEQGEQLIKSKVGYMSQRFTLYNDLTVEENLSFTAALRKIPPDRYAARRRELLELISFDRPLGTRVADLSGGMKQQVSLAAALLHDPDIVFLDEPTAGVTPTSRERFWSLIRKIAERGKTVFVTTHYMDEAEQCGRIALMRTGKLIALDSPDGLKKSTFPMPVYEFDPKRAMKFAEIVKLRSDPVFEFFEPYGVRFHAALRGGEGEWERAKARFEGDFAIRVIKPTLEDVFIRSVEERSGEGKVGE